jgi:LuxR family maltose regulon positive regulatory protein
MGVAEAQFDLAEVKLTAPLTRPGTVAKAGLIGRLSAASAPFATVVAPAGYGKTTLLGQWAARCRCPSAAAYRRLSGRSS